MKNDWQLILSLGAEGGTIKLFGKEQTLGEWVFKIGVNEMDYDDVDDKSIQQENSAENTRKLTPTNNKSIEQANSLTKALQFLDQFPWPMLSVQEVHPAFQKRIWKAFKVRYKQSYKNKLSNYRLNQWLRKCFPESSEEVRTLATWLQNSKYITILTGAGMSTESNIPDFRSKDGWWKNIDPRTVATTDALHNNYEIFHEFYSMKISGLKDCTPHRGHEILAEWELKGLIQAISTQNVDGFHSAAGNRNVYELHGSIRNFRCSKCSYPVQEEQFLQKEPCIECGGNLRPNVVLFGEELPEDSWSQSLNHIRKSDLVIVIGTSLEVYPASQLPNMTNGRTVYINFEVEKHTSSFDLIMKGKAGEVLQQVDGMVK
ncbi:NAD-dependent deacylase [Bacillus sp. JJ1566]|uniref:NAD-dependent deacylase n=1 Tax=Bacillus sp. JJ1566 TaxID=3122961 RepID=UPI002FFE475E